MVTSAGKGVPSLRKPVTWGHRPTIFRQVWVSAVNAATLPVCGESCRGWQQH
jgi:hypothetical protein